MFTGLVADLGTVSAVDASDGGDGAEVGDETGEHGLTTPSAGR